MEKIDRRIYQADKVICNNIDKFDASERGMLSQNILAHLRTFVEMVALKAYTAKKPNIIIEEDIPAANQYIKTISEWNFLAKLHDNLQISKSHYITSDDDAERLMLHYYRDLLRIKSILKSKYDMDVLHNIEKFPVQLDNSMDEYYERIAQSLDEIGIDLTSRCNLAFYVHKIKSFFVNEQVYYEVTLTPISDYQNKFNRIVVFTKLSFPINYAVRVSIKRTQVEIMNKNMPIRIVDNWHSALRACEIDKFIAILGKKRAVANTKEYQNLLNYLTESESNLLEIADLNEDWFEMVFERIHKGAHAKHIYEALKFCRKMFVKHKDGSNILRYLLFTMRNRVLKDQYSESQCYLLSNLKLQFGCNPFDQMPFATSPLKHNPYLHEIFKCISPNGRDHELLARRIINKTEINGVLFSEKKDLSKWNNVEELIEKYNDLIYKPRHNGRLIKTFGKNVYISEYETDTVEIIRRLQDCECDADFEYCNEMQLWLKENKKIDCDEKRDILCKLFAKSNVAFLYGAAGTGKTKMIEYVSDFFKNKSKIFLANTNTAKYNLEQRVNKINSEFYTAATFTSNKNIDRTCCILIIDECSSIGNRQMADILRCADFHYVLLVGDIHQIESIQFGNWFNIARHFVKGGAVFELTEPYRAENNNLQSFWNKVRNLDEDIVSYLSQCEYSEKPSEKIFEKTSNDEIVLCLNYDGLYGINNLNLFLQQSNSEKPIYWNEMIYKVGDPVLFNDSKRFEPYIYNNLKGRIVKINKAKTYIEFTVKLDIKLKEIDASKGFYLIGSKSAKFSTVRFRVYKHLDYNEDIDKKELQMPFQVAYAVSIHKAQGLEYDSVKVVITDEVEEKISHNIFYTAITRAKNKLKIYWSAEAQEKIVSNFDIVSNEKDAMILAKKNGLKFKKIKRK